jgi:multidrug efflux pump subunit AcrB
MVVALVLSRVPYAISPVHVLPTSFVPQEDQGYVMAAIIMPERRAIDAQRWPRRSTDLRQDSGSQPAR